MATNQLWFLKRDTRYKHISTSLFAGCIMLCASFLPWLCYPLGPSYSAWQLPVDIGWQFRSSLFNYGLLCLCCAIFAFVVAYTQWRHFQRSNFFASTYRTVGIICIVPLVLFLIQYLFVDMGTIALLARQKMQLLLLEKQFGYSVVVERISLKPFQIDVSTIKSRFVLLFDQAQIGVVLPAISAWMLMTGQRFVAQAPRVKHSSKTRRVILFLTLTLVLCLVFGRGFLATFSDDEARSMLSTGKYAQALYWLNVADVLNPELEEVAFYHIERGKAMYYLSPRQESDERRVYLAWVYREEGDYLDAYQELLAVSSRTTPWVVDEMSVTLARLSNSPHPLNSLGFNASREDESALPWLQDLVQLDASNVYALYMIGRIQYDLHNYAASQAAMNQVVRLDVNADVLSSAYTYMALSDDGLGRYASARLLLFKAIQFDPHFHNNTAREELSGLR